MRHDVLAGAHHVEVKRIALVRVFGNHVAGLLLAQLGRGVISLLPQRRLGRQAQQLLQHGIQALSGGGASANGGFHGRNGRRHGVLALFSDGLQSRLPGVG